MKIEGVEHEWIEHHLCKALGCKRHKWKITWCDNCDRAFCKDHEEYHNDYDEGQTYCKECWETKQYWDKKEEN